MDMFRNFFMFETTPRMGWVRPKDVPFPAVWRRFEGRKPGPDGRLPRFKVQDLTDDLVDEAIGLLLKHFVNDEPPCKQIGLSKCPNALREIEQMWREAVADGVSLVCLTDEPTPSGRPRVVGVNILNVNLRGQKDTLETTDPVWKQLFGAVLFVANSVDVCEMYQVDKYLGAVGLVVEPEYRGQNLGLEILKARIPLCRALDIKLTATVFTAAASQVVAKKCGFKVISEFTYDELAEEHGFVFPGVTSLTKSSQLMVMEI